MDPNPRSYGHDARAAGPYRVVQWGTGGVGGHALRAVLNHPDLVLAGVWVHDPAKAGVDAGVLCGSGVTTGVAATTDVDEILALGADCVLYMPRLFDADDVCRLLVAGVNVVTTHGDLRHPDTVDPAVCARVEAACWFGGASILSTGIAPGFVTETLPVALSSIQRSIDRMSIEESVDLARPGTSRLLLETMGFGAAPAPFDEQRLAHAEQTFGPSLRLVADAVRLPLDAFDVRGEVALAENDMPLEFTTLAAGTVAAQRITVSGRGAGRVLLRLRSTWYCTPALRPAWPIRATGWHVAIDGETPIEMDLRYPVDPSGMSAISPRYAANRAVNAVAYLCAAPPGIRTTLDLPPLTANLS
ncbi:dihydrodipicolinate reductase [Nocardia abscessus]|uniref:NAD(P)H-dependent amine dehydrogenase family protein n=1 Tax=Nocardia abscessus TaxID=120957 RepID=UPI002453B2E4|nr:dihydrodipicolinate reductase [Nocardia abscessus]